MLGRFMTPYPYVAGENGIMNPMDTQRWNRYTYARADPTKSGANDTLISQNCYKTLGINKP